MSGTNIPSIKLNNGNEMPVIGFGTYNETDLQKVQNSVKEAIQAGYRHIDCAYIYMNEEAVGKALKEAIAESNGKLKRQDFFITSKCWMTFSSKKRVPQCLEKILKFLQIDYLDLYLIHWPVSLKEDVDADIPKDEKGQCIPSDVHYLETYEAMEELVRQNKVKSIGVSNFNIEQVQEVLKHCKIRPVCNQIEVNAYFTNAELVSFCQKENIVVVGYAPLGAPARQWRENGEKCSIEDEVILKIAKKHDKTPAQVILRWLINSNVVPIPKSVTPSRIRENLDVFDFDLSNEECEQINKLNNNTRSYQMETFANHRFYPFKK